MATLESVQLTDTQYEDIWSATIQEYERNTKVPLPANLNSLDNVLHLVEEQQKQFAQFCNKRQLRPIVKDILSVIESFTDVVGAGVGVVS